MRTILIFIGAFFTSTSLFAQVNSVEFKKSAEVIIIEEPPIRYSPGDSLTAKQTTAPESEKRKIIIEHCQYPYPIYSDLTGGGVFRFSKISRDIKFNLSILSSSLSVDNRSEFYIYYLSRSKSFTCPEFTHNNKASFGVAVYVIFKISNLDSKLTLNSPFDIAAAAQLNLAKVEVDVQTIGMNPSLQNEFMPENINKINTEIALYIEKINSAAKSKLTNENTFPELLPIDVVKQ